ncbi:MAG: cyclic nucleotide-binding domain-containing protein [Nitrospinota bacterium]
MQEYTTEQILSFLSENEIFQQAPEFSNFLKEDFEDFLEITQITTIQKGGTVFTKGDKANSILLILRGEVGIFEAESTGKLTPVATVAERSFVGEMGIIEYNRV